MYSASNDRVLEKNVTLSGQENFLGFHTIDGDEDGNKEKANRI